MWTYVVVAYVLAYGAHVSYAVGEWRACGPGVRVQVIRVVFHPTRFREPLYHTVLEQYVRLITSATA